MTTVKVIHVIAGLKKVGGAELMLKRLIETQNGGSEFEHSIISLSDLGEFGQGLIEAGISVDVLGMTSMRDMPRVLLRLIGIFRERRPDIVQTWMYHWWIGCQNGRYWRDYMGSPHDRPSRGRQEYDCSGTEGVCLAIRILAKIYCLRRRGLKALTHCCWLQRKQDAGHSQRFRSHSPAGDRRTAVRYQEWSWHRGQRYRDWQSRQIPPGKGSCFLCRSCRSAGSTLFALEVSFGGTGAAVFQC